MPFLDPLDFDPIEDPGRPFLRLSAAICYVSASQTAYTVPGGFVCDLASVPAWLRGIVPHWLRSARAGILHDLLYRWGPEVGVTREEADDLFREALLSDGCSGFEAWRMWKAVRLFGRQAWVDWRMSALHKGPEPPRPVRI